MYQLLAIGENPHPENGFFNIVNRFSGTKYDVSEMYGAAIARDFMIVQTGAFWEEITSRLTKGSGMSRKDRDAVQEEFAILKELYVREFAAIRNSKQVYLEGRRKHVPYASPVLRFFQRMNTLPDPIERFVHSLGIGAEYLDEDNEHYERLLEMRLQRPRNSLAEEEEQRRREAVWVTRIPATHIQDSLLIAGLGHLENEFGLVDRLKEKDIALELI
jgi:hypothetical protein